MALKLSLETSVAEEEARKRRATLQGFSTANTTTVDMGSARRSLGSAQQPTGTGPAV